MQRAVLKKSWRQHPSKQQLYSHLLSIIKTIQVRRTKQAGHCSRSKVELISDILLWTPSYGRAKVGRSARTNIQQFGADTGCSLENMPGAINDSDGWRERLREICASSSTRWRWWWAALSPTPQCSSYWKGSLWVTIDLGCQDFTYIYIYMLVRIFVGIINLRKH